MAAVAGAQVEGPAGKTQSSNDQETPLFAGEVDLVVEPFADMVRLVEFHDLLNNVEGLTVVSTAGSWDRGTTITVTLARPLRLNDLSEQMPGINVRQILTKAMACGARL